MGGGAILAIAAAARLRRIQEIADAFRLADATTPERAKSCAAVGVDTGQAELTDLIQDGVLVEGRAADTLYLDERAFIARQAARRDNKKLALLSLVLLAVVLMGLGYFTAMTVR